MLEESDQIKRQNQARWLTRTGIRDVNCNFVEKIIVDQDENGPVRTSPLWPQGQLTRPQLTRPQADPNQHLRIASIAQWASWVSTIRNIKFWKNMIHYETQVIFNSSSSENIITAIGMMHRDVLNTNNQSFSLFLHYFQVAPQQFSSLLQKEASSASSLGDQQIFGSRSC
jgi:hypothetical protein